MNRLHAQLPDAETYWLKQIKCQEACPVHTDARGYVRAIAENRFEEAYLIARGPNPLASICGRVCGAPCEAACRRSDLDEAVSIRALKRFALDHHSARKECQKPGPFDLVKRLIDHATGRQSSRAEELASFVGLLSEQEMKRTGTGEKVAIIGSGPAGLAAAHDLALLGFRPTVFEMEPVPAGMLAVGIPQYRLPRELIQAEVEFIRSPGVEFLCNTQIGKDITLAEIRRQHRATIIAVGLKRSRALPIPGADTPGVHGGVEFLRNVALGKDVDVRGNVVVIGGGNVAYDIARTVVRQTGVDISRLALRSSAVHSVRLVSLESLEELPADDAEILEGDEEGVIRENGWGPVDIIAGSDGRVSGVVFQRCTRVFDENRRFSPQFDASQRRTIAADTVLWGIGQRPDLSFIDAEDIQRDERGLIKVDATTFRTTAGEFPPGTRAADLPDEAVPSHFLDVFGRPARNSACECERVDAPALGQTLELVSSNEIHQKLTAAGGYVDKLVKDGRPHAENVQAIFTRVFARPPRENELQTAVRFLESQKNPHEGYRSLLWALLATNEFLFNH